MPWTFTTNMFVATIQLQLYPKRFVSTFAMRWLGSTTFLAAERHLFRFEVLEMAPILRRRGGPKVET